ncbi:histidine kinase [Pseudonocardia sp. C8]|uniref:sensor histidine kinase n=1 Tax=Pseudonocardia sp. C8 TaxID=2762759 RepID=UPI001C92D3F9
MTSESELRETHEAERRVPAQDAFGRRAARRMVLVAVVSLILTAGVSTLLAFVFARVDALGEAERSARALASGVFEPAVGRVVAGDRAAREALARSMYDRSHDGAVIRANLWGADGRIVWSTEPVLDGVTLPLPDEVRAAIDGDRASAELSTLDSDQGGSTGPGIVETYAPLTAPDGRRFAVEIYSSDARVQQATIFLTSVLVPASVVILAVLQLANMPIAVSMIRRMGEHGAERERLQRRAMLASDRERRAIAAELHDGVVQQLTGVGYLLSSLERSWPDPPDEGDAARARQGITTASSLVRDSIATLRNLMVDIYPPSVGRGGLPDALAELAGRVQATGVDVAVTCAVDDMDEEHATLLYRSAREAMQNVMKHAGAANAWLTVEQDDGAVALQLDDDGVGPSTEHPDRRAEGHLGLALLRDSVSDLNGRLELTNRPGGGARFRVELPILHPPHGRATGSGAPR